MQKLGSYGGEKFALVTLINQEKPVEEEELFPTNYCHRLHITTYFNC